jgi:ribosomal protein S18 acetylase RimI-like enzyme
MSVFVTQAFWPTDRTRGAQSEDYSDAAFASDGSSIQTLALSAEKSLVVSTSGDVHAIANVDALTTGGLPTLAELAILADACDLNHPPNRIDKDLWGMLRKSSSRVFLLHDGREWVGLTVATEEGRRGWIQYVGVKAKYRQGGRGRALVLAADHYLLSLGLGGVLLFVRKTAPELLEFYAKLGYGTPAVTLMGKYPA